MDGPGSLNDPAPEPSVGNGVGTLVPVGGVNNPAPGTSLGVGMGDNSGESGNSGSPAKKELSSSFSSCSMT